MTTSGTNEKSNLPSESFLEEISNQDNLLVSFSGIAHERDEVRFEFREVSKSMSCDKIFIKDTRQMWYQKGISPQMDTVEKVCEYLQKIIDQHSYKKVCFIGNSMGGYAAILFGTLLNVDTVYAFSPQTFIDTKNRLTFKDTRWALLMEQVYTQTQDTYWNLAHVLAEHSDQAIPFKTQINIFHGLHYLDTLHAKHLSQYSQVHITEYPGPEHNIVRLMRDDGKLKPLLSGIFQD